MLVLAPAACCLAGIAANEALLTLSRSVRGRLGSSTQSVLEGCINLDSSTQAPVVVEPSGDKRLDKRSSKKAAADPIKVG